MADAGACGGVPAAAAAAVPGIPVFAVIGGFAARPFRLYYLDVGLADYCRTNCSCSEHLYASYCRLPASYCRLFPPFAL